MSKLKLAEHQISITLARDYVVPYSILNIFSLAEYHDEEGEEEKEKEEIPI